MALGLGVGRGAQACRRREQQEMWYGKQMGRARAAGGAEHTLGGRGVQDRLEAQDWTGWGSSKEEGRQGRAGQGRWRHGYGRGRGGDLSK